MHCTATNHDSCEARHLARNAGRLRMTEIYSACSFGTDRMNVETYPREPNSVQNAKTQKLNLTQQTAQEPKNPLRA